MREATNPAVVCHSFTVPLCFTLCLLLCGCARSERAGQEAAPAYQPSPVAPASLVKMPEVAAPKLAEVQEAVKRVFKDAALVDASSQPSFIAGDFNGDASEDLAVVLKPAPGKLAEMNETYPAWLLREPVTGNRPPQLHVEEQDLLLGVIHGFGENDWRDPQATQTYLLKNAVGSGMEVRTGKDFVATNSGRKLPKAKGDLIAEVLHGTSGYLYYANATYAWYDPKTFKADPEQRPFHGMKPAQ